MIIGIGTDILSYKRFKNACQRFPHTLIPRLFTPEEIKHAHHNTKYHAYFAKRFSAKESILKALGTGLSHGLTWQSISITNDSNGKPLAHLNGPAHLRAQHLSTHNTYTLHLSLSDEKDIISTFAVLESLQAPS